MRITTIEPFRERLFILDGSAGRVHLIEQDGRVAISGSPPGRMYEIGDIRTQWQASFVRLVDGAGSYFNLVPEFFSVFGSSEG